MDMLPVTVGVVGGGTVTLLPDRALAAVASGIEESFVWHVDPVGSVERLQVRAEAEHMRAALGLDEPEDADG